MKFIHEETAAIRGSIDMKIATAPAFLFIAVVFAPAAWSQCTGAGDSGVQCLSPDIYAPPNDTNPHARPQQPQAVWTKRWGAIAIDNGTSSVGVSENQTSKSAASAESLQRCASKSNSQHCEMQLAYYNQCAALAWGTKYSGIGHAETQGQAQSEALQGCAKGAHDCKVVYSACSLPVRVHV